MVRHGGWKEELEAAVWEDVGGEGTVRRADDRWARFRVQLSCKGIHVEDRSGGWASGADMIEIGRSGILALGMEVQLGGDGYVWIAEAVR